MARKRLYSLNEEFFTKIDTEQKAYWLGFIYADGFISIAKSTNQHNLSIKLSVKDKVHLEKFRAEITSRPIRDYAQQTKYGLINFSQLIISSKRIVQDLQRLGCVQNKSLILTFPTINQVPQNLINHFIRGYFDGDGSVFIQNKGKYNYLGVSICGTKEMLEGIKSNCIFLLNNSKCIYHDYRHLGKNIFSFKLLSNVRCQNFYEFLYNGAEVYMERKKVIFDSYRSNACNFESGAV